jgi:two-component system sensor histidine kinase HydH
MQQSLDPSGPDSHLMRLGQLASALAHEIRNPLAAIVLHVDVLEEELQQPTADSQARMTESVGEVKAVLGRITELVENYLSLARLIELRREPVALGAVIETFARERQEQFARRGIALHLEGLATLGQLHLHQNAFHRVLVNLVQNAVDAMPQGGTLILRGQRDTSQVRLEIQDTGDGVAADQWPLLFEPFHTTKADGTGLGLYVVKQIITAHGGTITLTSTPGQGTLCAVMLPLAAVPTGVH